MATRLTALLEKAAATGAPLLTFEPAFGMMLRQDYPHAGFQPPRVQMVEEFLADHARSLPPAQSATTATLLSHCTQATAEPESAANWGTVFAAFGVTLDAPTTGCCGMAGLFGHQRRHQIVSRKLFDLSWRRHLEKDVQVAATGFSCRCQSKRLAGRAARHPLGLIADILEKAH